MDYGGGMSYRGGGRGGGGGGRGGGRGGKPFVVTTKLYVGNIPETCRRVELQKLFEQYGTVTECDIVKNYGFIHYENPNEAEAAEQALNNFEWEGIQLKVELSHSRVRHKPGMGGKQECYRCGKEGHWSKDCPKGPSRPKGFTERGGRDPYPSRDPYDSYYRDSRYGPPPLPMDRYRPYPDLYDRRPPPPRDPYYTERDPYTRPPPEYYGRSREFSRDPYMDYYERRGYMPPPPGTSRMSPPRARVAPY